MVPYQNLFLFSPSIKYQYLYICISRWNIIVNSLIVAEGDTSDTLIHISIIFHIRCEKMNITGKNWTIIFFSVRFSHFTGYHTFGNIWRWRKCIFQWNVWNITSLIMHIFAQYLFCACVTTYRMIYFSAFMQTPNLSFFISPASWHCLYVTC